jgi:dihydroxyacid dehydratase/phosphogluconate dehydratase
MTRKNPDELRSHRWYGVQDLRSFGHRSRMKQMGLALADFAGKPVIAVVNTWNGLAHCHAHFPNRVQDIKRGVLEAGGFPVRRSKVRRYMMMTSSGRWTTRSPRRKGWQCFAATSRLAAA